MKKVFGQTVRDLKREVNKKVLKVPGIEQKVLDATSNEPWGPHGSLLADLAQASRNYHEYQMIMVVIWKRLSDTGKNWRHVYKALTVLEYMVGHGSERVIEEIKERAYQISTLSSFQYIDSGGRDQGSNVRKKSQSLVALVNDKERISEVREKAAANRDKFRSSAPGGMYKPSGGYGDKYDYGSRDEERNSCGYRDDDRNSRDGDRYSRDSEDRGRDGNREDDNNRGRSRSVDNYQHGSRGMSSDRERGFEDDGQDRGQQLQRKFSEQNIGATAAPPSYEEAVSESQSPVYSAKDGGETPQVVASGAASPPPPPQVAAPGAASPPPGSVNESFPQKFEAFDEFDPRGSFSAVPPVNSSTDGVSAPPTVASTPVPPPSANSVEMDLLGSLAEVFSSNALALVPADSTFVETNGEANAPSFSTSQPLTQSFDDPFGDSPFKAFTSTDTNSYPQQSFQPTTQPAFTSEVSHPDTANNFGIGESFSAVNHPEPSVHNLQPQEQFATSHSDIDDILAGILPPSQQSGPTIPTSQFPTSGNNMYDGFHPQPVSGQTPFGQATQPYNTVPHSQNMTGVATPFHSGGFMNQPGSTPAGQFMPQQPSHGGIHRTQSGPVSLQGNNNLMGEIYSQPGPPTSSSMTSSSSQPDLTPFTGAIEIVPPPQKKFEPKSSVWADTLSRGLVNFNISGSKTNPLADIGVDFEAINRREKRLEKPTNTPAATSTINMGKAMGSGTGLGRSGATSMRPPPNPMVAAGMPMGGVMGIGGGGGYGGMNQNQQMGMGMRPGMSMNMGGYGQGRQGYPMQPQNPGPNIPNNNYNPMMGQGGYNPQQSYTGGCR